VAGAQEQLLEFVVPDLNCMLVDHIGKLPGPLPLPAAAAHDQGAAREREHGPSISPLHSPQPPLNRETSKCCWSIRSNAQWTSPAPHPPCCWPLLTDHGQRVVYVPGRTVNRMSAGYQGDAKTDARDAYVIAIPPVREGTLPPSRSQPNFATPTAG
jgi:hypothetical protein